jgi:hypothetical protein
MEFTGAAQGLAGPGAVSVFARVMHQQDSQFELALKPAQIREQGRDLRGVVFISCDHRRYVTSSCWW